MFGSDAVPYFMMEKRIIILFLLFGIAIVDVKCYVILPQFLWMGLGIRVFFLFLEGFHDVYGAFSQIVSEAAGSGLILVVSLLVYFFSGKGIGMGDVKLFSFLSLFLGFKDSVRAIFYALLFLLTSTCLCLVTKKKTKKDVLPFAPALLGGTCLLFLIG